jgi:hypothetical protein
MQTDSETDTARSGSVQPDCSAMADAEAEQVAWEWFAGAHPHEAHAKWPDRFWTFFQSRCPGVTREQMERTLMETGESPNAKVSDAPDSAAPKRRQSDE